MNKEKSFQEPELRNGIVRRVDSLQSLFSRDTDPDIRGL